MIVKSPYADKEFNIPDEKLPDAPRFAMKCPFTGKKIVFEKGADGFVVKAAEDALPQPRAEEKTEAKPALQLPQVEPDIFPPGTKTAFLFLDESWTGSARTFFEGKGYAVSSASDELEAIAKLRLNNYDVVVAEDCVQSCENLLGEVSSWPGGKRQGVNYILVGEGGKSNDPQAAFLAGANTYLNALDGAEATDLLEGALTGYELYYQLLENAKNA